MENNKAKYIYEDGIKIEKIPYSYENGRDTKKETLYDRNFSYSYDGLYSSSNHYTEEEFANVRDSLDKSFEFVGRKKQNLRKKYNDFIYIYIYGITKDESKIVEISIRKSFDKFLNYVTIVGRLKNVLKIVYADLKVFEEEVGTDFSSKLTCESKFL